MKISNNIHFFNSKETVGKKVDKNLLGIRGRQANEFAELKLPILPGIIIDASVVQDLGDVKIYSEISSYLSKFGSEVKKTYGDPDSPLLLKLVISPNMLITSYPTLHNFGLTKDTVIGFQENVGEDFAANEVLFLLNGILTVVLKIEELEKNDQKVKDLEKVLHEIKESMKMGKIGLKPGAIMDKYSKFLPKHFFDDCKVQLEESIHLIARLLTLEEDTDHDVALLIQPMVYGNYSKDSYSGSFFSRNIVNGEKKLQGQFFAEKFNEVNAEGKDINSIKPEYLKHLQQIAWQLEDYTKDIRNIRFTIEAGRLWLIEQKSVEAKSTISMVQILLDLYNRKIVDEIIKGRYSRCSGSRSRQSLFYCRLPYRSSKSGKASGTGHKMYSMYACNLCRRRKGHRGFYRCYIERRRLFGPCFRCCPTVR